MMSTGQNDNLSCFLHTFPCLFGAGVGRNWHLESWGIEQTC